MNKISVSERKSIALYLLMYWPLGVLFPLLGQYLSSIGFSGTQVGTITSVGTAAAAIFGMVWGKLYTNSKRKRVVIALIFLGAAAMSLTSLTTQVFTLYLVIYATMLAFQGPVHGLVDSLVMAKNENFPLERAFGAIGYSLAAGIGGRVAQSFGLSTIFYMHAVGFIAAAVIIMTKQEPPHYVKKEGKTFSAKECFKDKDFIQLLICAFFLLGPTMGTNTYLGYLVKEGGGDISQIGNAFLIMTASEAVVMVFVPYLNKKFPTEKLVMFGMAVGVIRYIYYSTGPSVSMICVTFFLQGLQNGIMLIEIVRFFEKVVHPTLAALSVSTYYAIGNNCSTIVCNFFGGVILDSFGAKGVFTFFAIMSAIGLVLYILMGLYKVKDRAYNI